jgi:hypothetical protein
VVTTILHRAALARRASINARRSKGKSAMDKRVLLVANTSVPYGGRVQGVGMQFDCDEATAADLVKAGQASVVAPAPAAVRPTTSPTDFPKLDADPKK